MKVRYINDVPENIKAIAFLGNDMNLKISQLELNIKLLNSEIAKLENKKSFQGLTSQEETFLDNYKNDLQKYINDLNFIKQSVIREEERNNIMYLIIPAIIIFALIKRKK